MMTEEQRELVDFINQEIDKWDDERRYVRVMEIALAALTQPASQALNLPDGWVAVPVEPNWEMLSADGCKEHHNGQTCLHHDNRRRIWASMLAAAPVPHTAPIEPICAAGGAEWVKPVPRELQQVLLELRTYNPKADEYGGKHIIPGWADRIEKALGIKPAAPKQAFKAGDIVEQSGDIAEVLCAHSNGALDVREMKSGKHYGWTSRMCVLVERPEGD